MTRILALETATEACSLALLDATGVRQCHEVIPRGHSRRVFGMLRELLPGGDLAAAGVTLLAYGSGPGSFTGLRIAASLTQGLAFSTGLPAVGIPTLAALAQTALRSGVVTADDSLLCTLDARLNEIYCAVYEFQDGFASLREGPWALAPGDLSLRGTGRIKAVGSGCNHLGALPPELAARIDRTAPGLLPEARDVAELARAGKLAGAVQAPFEIAPVYVRDEIGWKKLAEQGRRG